MEKREIPSSYHRKMHRRRRRGALRSGAGAEQKLRRASCFPRCGRRVTDYVSFHFLISFGDTGSPKFVIDIAQMAWDKPCFKEVCVSTQGDRNQKYTLQNPSRRTQREGGHCSSRLAPARFPSPFPYLLSSMYRQPSSIYSRKS